MEEPHRACGCGEETEAASGAEEEECVQVPVGDALGKEGLDAEDRVRVHLMSIFFVAYGFLQGRAPMGHPFARCFGVLRDDLPYYLWRLPACALSHHGDWSHTKQSVPVTSDGVYLREF